jgi:hypothetical protein
MSACQLLDKTLNEQRDKIMHDAILNPEKATNSRKVPWRPRKASRLCSDMLLIGKVERRTHSHIKAELL